MVFFMFSSTFVVLALFVSAFLLRAVYRLTLHPLAQYLGPFSGMVPSAYGMSYDFSSRSRGYILELPKLHDKHGAKYPSHAPGRDILISLIGPTIRIQPNELHIRDLDGYYQVFRPGTPFDKYTNSYNTEATRGFFNIPGSRDVKPWKDIYQP